MSYHFHSNLYRVTKAVRFLPKPLWGLSSSNPYHPSHVPNTLQNLEANQFCGSGLRIRIRICGYVSGFADTYPDLRIRIRALIQINPGSRIRIRVKVTQIRNTEANSCQELFKFSLKITTATVSPFQYRRYSASLRLEPSLLYHSMKFMMFIPLFI